MVVVSGNWVKYVKYPSPVIDNDMVISGNMETRAAKAVLCCRQNSYHFADRTLSLDEAVKIGRAVARVKPTTTNAIFDCKVLSRHHALLWYDNGKFYLQDTKSSNGTFVNNIRLTAETEHHELSSGDIVQFGVDVVENNRKVTHGCIVAKLRLFLPDGKEAKASPSITEGDRPGMFPLDDLYKLNQVIQEAKQREQCMENKLTMLQRIIDETRKSADESWQAYVGEERLLSHVSALENKLQQANKHLGEEHFRDALAKQQETNDAYQIAAKEALEKLHAERLEAQAMATKQERARITAEQEAILAREQALQAQMELEELAQKLMDEQNKMLEERRQMDERQRELEDQLENNKRIVDWVNLQVKDDPDEKSSVIYNDLKAKEKLLLAENEGNGMPNHITLSVRPVEDVTETDESEAKVEKVEKVEKKVTIKLPDETDEEDSQNQTQIHNGASDVTVLKNDAEDGDKDKPADGAEKGDYVNSKTLKYQFQTAQNELKQKIEMLESLASVNKTKLAELDRELVTERDLSEQRLAENVTLRKELSGYEHKWKATCNEAQQLRDRVVELTEQVSGLVHRNSPPQVEEVEKDGKLVPLQQLVNVEEELVLLKERFALIGDEKLKLQHELLHLSDQYKDVCNRSYNKHFFYVAPLVIMVLYLLISAMIS